MEFEADIISPQEIDPTSLPDLLQRAIDPVDPALSVVGWPNRRLSSRLATGDIILRTPANGAQRMAILSDPTLIRPGDARKQALLAPGALPGRYVRAVTVDSGSPALLRIAGGDGMMLAETWVVRADPAALSAENEMLPPLPVPPAPTARPTIRRGSRGPAVAEAQAKLNRVHMRQLSSGGRGLDKAPLDVDGLFGPKTQAATLSFQKLAFPGNAAEWDGIIGPKTWAQLDLWSRETPIGPIDPIDPIPPVPIIPVVDRPLDPPRWGPILSAAKSSVANMRSGNLLRTLIDGRETFEEMASDIRKTDGKTDYIYLLGWDMVDDFDLIPDPSTTSIFPHACPAGGPQKSKKRSIEKLLTEASGRGVQIRVMLWAKPPFAGALAVRWINKLPTGAAIRDDETANNGPVTKEKLRAALIAVGIAPVLTPLIISLFTKKDLARFGGAHHQKVLIVKRGDLLVAYCGGVDINSNRLYVVDGKHGDPQHDAHVRVLGPSAWDLLDTFRKRWRHHPESAKIDAGSKGPLLGVSEPVPAAPTAPPPGEFVTGGPQTVIIARTFNPVHKVPGVGRERDIRHLILAAIRSADRFIYMEDQYLMDQEVATALNKAVPKLQHLTLLISPTTDTTMPPLLAEYREKFVDTVLSGLSTRDAAKVGVFQPTSSQTEWKSGCHTYVHAKTWVFDDELAVIGSANCNRRGYQHDSEVDAFIFDDPVTSPPLVAFADVPAPREALPSILTRPTFAQFYRMRLWHEHLGMPLRSLTDGVASAAFWRRAGRPATARVIEFDHRLPSGATADMFRKAAEALRDLIDPVP